MDAAVAGLIGAVAGAVLGAIGTIGTTWIHSHYQAKREKGRTILEYALAHRRESFDYADKVPGPTVVEPLAVHVHYQKGLIELIEGGTLTAATLSELSRENEQLADAFRQAKKERAVAKVLAERGGK